MSWWWSPYPGKGPWSWLPPPLRPGWWLGRGWCWLLWWPYVTYSYPWPFPAIPDPELERRYLEEIKRYLSDVVIREIDRRLEVLRGEKKTS
ncbi:MAG: DUF5320 domain-containing protein [Ignisphaera sp.]